MAMDPMDDPLSDAALIRAARKRLLAELEAKQEAAIVNNVYGGAGGSAHASSGGGTDGVMGLLGGSPGASGEDPFDYLVDIERKDLPINPDTGKPMGWQKSVRRHRSPKEHGKKKE